MRVIWALGDVGDVGGPVLPVGAGADLVDDPGVDRVAPLSTARTAPAASAVSLARRSAVGSSVSGSSSSVRADVRTEQLVDAFAGLRVALVQLDPVDHRVEAVVVGAQRLEDLPDDLVPLVVGQRLRGRDRRRGRRSAG